MFNHLPSRGRQIAAFIALVVAFLLPKQVRCLKPGATCEAQDADGRYCQPTDLEPFGIYLIEAALDRDLPVAYRTSCEPGL